MENCTDFTIPEEKNAEPKGNADKGTRVLVMALSTFPTAREKKLIGPGGREETFRITLMRGTRYCYEEYTSSEGKAGSLKLIHVGSYQLEPVSVFIKEELDNYVTDVVLLATSETMENRREIVFPSPYSKQRKIDYELIAGKEAAGENAAGKEAAEKNDVEKGVVEKASAGGKKGGKSFDLEKFLIKTVLDNRENSAENAEVVKRDWTALEYFSEWLKECWGKELRIHPIEIDEMKPACALNLVMDKIRELYNNTEDKDNWRLWIDTHGGFRDISMVLISAARFFATDMQDPIDTNGIFSVYHSQRKEIDDRIIDQTAFYFTESAEALKNFLDYGQYLALKFKPYGGEKKHAFISYRHDKRFITSVRNILTQFEKHGILFWYDDGIRPRDNWKVVLERQNMDSEVFIGLLSNSYFQSKECWKELINAVSGKKGRYEKIHFIMLEENVDLTRVLPVSLENPEETKEVQERMQELGVTVDELRECLGIGNINSNIQWFQWFGYMQRGTAVRERSTADLDERIKSTLEMIRDSIVNA
ncbi:MAG: toll/interleukin-1 receptor domain-containing protein [Eubacteriales bacterium]|nr:toll/interleukin-1 receptor domain-containing protein [Eubacteriales bacterium]